MCNSLTRYCRSTILAAKQRRHPTGSRGRTGRFSMFGRTRSLVLSTAAALVALCGAAFAQEYPTKPITLIVPWPAGGSTDIAMRAIADSASKHIGQPIAIDNKAGGGGTVGPATMAATGKPDG